MHLQNPMIYENDRAGKNLLKQKDMQHLWVILQHADTL